jgi:CheY-like chemotaxis protein
MPVMEGLETIISRRLDPNVKIIAMTGGRGEARVGHLRSAEMFGAVGTIGKPFSGTEIVMSWPQLSENKRSG